MTSTAVDTRCLSLHAGYGCRHAGACCAAPWQVKADEHVVRFVSSNGFAARLGTLFVNQPARAGSNSELSLAKRPGGDCVFHEDRRCSIQVKGGEPALPIGCRHYPRVLRIDPRDVALSLSHYCPTAAALLVADAPIHIVRAAAPLALAEPIEGLDAREALPPLLRPGLLMDLDSYSAWELAAVDLFARETAGAALRRLAVGTEALRDWTPGSTPLQTRLAEVFSSPPDLAVAWVSRGIEIAHALNRGLITWTPVANLDEAWASVRMPDAASERVLSNYLAARTFGNWIAYQGRGLRTVVSWLHACYDVARVLLCRTARDRALTIADVIEAVRHADYVMLHTVDTQQFADAAHSLET